MHCRVALSLCSSTLTGTLVLGHCICSILFRCPQVDSQAHCPQVEELQPYTCIVEFFWDRNPHTHLSTGIPSRFYTGLFAWWQSYIGDTGDTVSGICPPVPPYPPKGNSSAIPLARLRASTRTPTNKRGMGALQMLSCG